MNKKKPVILTMDVEPDLAVHLRGSYFGIGSLGRFLELIGTYKASCDFFVTGDVAQKYPDSVRSITTSGHRIGCHGSDHIEPYYCRKPYKWQLFEIRKSSEIIHKVSGVKIDMFRAPNFSVNGDTIKALEDLGFNVDSSILPGRRVRKMRALTVLDFRGAPRVPYLSSKETVSKPGNSSVVEIPLTENPHMRGAPIGMGYLNLFGVEKTMQALDAAEGDYATFLMHPWEMVDLGKYHPSLPQNWKESCKENWDVLGEFMKIVAEVHGFISIEKVRSEFLGKPDRN